MPPLLKLHVQIAKGRNGTIVVRDGDSPQALAEAFVDTFKLHNKFIKIITERINTNLLNLGVPGSKNTTPVAVKSSSRPDMPKLDLSQLGQGGAPSITKEKKTLASMTSFEAFDANHDGVIDLGEFQQGMSALASQAPSQAPSQASTPAATPLTSQRQMANSMPRASTPRSRSNSKHEGGNPRKPNEGNNTARGKTRGDDYVLFNLDIDLGKNSSAGRIAVRAGDDPKRLAIEFAATHGLPENATARLQKLITENMKLHKR